jgi:beta-lactamase regulating signal transducer with metallopeptidase domain
MDLLSPQLINVAGWTLIHSVWQLTLIAFCYLTFRAVLRVRNQHSNPQLLYGAGCCALLAMLAAPLFTGAILSLNPQSRDWTEHAFHQAGSPETTMQRELVLETNPATIEPIGVSKIATSTHLAIAESASPEPVSTNPPTLFFWLVLAWILGVMLFAIRPTLGMLNVRRLVNSKNKPAPERLQKIAEQIGTQLRVRRLVRLVESALVQVPTVVGYFRPVILLPATAVTGLTESQLKLILTHEFAHIQRNDFLVNVGQSFIETLLFYHPAIWWISGQVRMERENCCDDLAANHSGGPVSLAEALMALEESRVVAPALAANGGQLVSRIRRLLHKPEPKVRLGLGWTTCGLIALISMIALSASMAIGPQDKYRVSEAEETLLTTPPNPTDDLPSSEILPPLKMEDVIAVVNNERIAYQEVLNIALSEHGLETLQQMVTHQLLKRELQRLGVKLNEDDLSFDEAAEKFGMTANQYVDLVCNERMITKDQLMQIRWREVAALLILQQQSNQNHLTQQDLSDEKNVKALLESLKSRADVSITPNEKTVAKLGETTISRAQLEQECFQRHGLNKLNRLISRRLLEQELEKNGISLTKEDIQSEYLRMEERLGFEKSNAIPPFDSFANAALRKLVDRTVNVSVTAEEIEQAVETNFGPRAKVLAVVTSEQTTAVKVWQLATANPTRENFSNLAKQFSIEPISKNRGEVPPIRLNDGRPLLEQAAFALKEGDVSEVVQVGESWVVLFGLGQTRLAKDFSAETKRKEVRKNLLEKKTRLAMQEKMQAILKSATIKRVVASPGEPPVQLPRVKEADDASLTTKTYAVADLVVAHHPFFISSPAKNTEQKVDFEPLLKLIKETVAPDSWNNCTAQPFEDHLALIVSQTQKNHEALADLLDRLRELYEVTIDTSGFLVTLPKAEFRHIPEGLEDSKPISKRQAVMLHAVSVAKDTVMHYDFPMFSTYNGQTYALPFGESSVPDNQKPNKYIQRRFKNSPSNMGLELSQTISPDRQSMTTLFSSNRPGEQGMVLKSKSGQFMAVDVTSLLDWDANNERAIFVYKSQVSEYTE